MTPDKKPESSQRKSGRRLPIRWTWVVADSGERATRFDWPMSHLRFMYGNKPADATRGGKWGDLPNAIATFRRPR